MITGDNNSEILTIKEPTIINNEIGLENFDSNSIDVIGDASKIEGSFAPVIRINTLRLETNDIVKFKLTSSGFLPTLDLVFYDNGKIFEGDFPKDGDLVELYIRSRNDKTFKKIRVDFDILTISSNSTIDTTIFSLRCIMKIPNLFSQRQLSFNNNTSFNHLLEICDLIQTGFASNEISTDDSMPRFNSNNNIKDFIEKTVKTSYKNDNSFFTSYIDYYKYLCLVNVNNLFSLNDELEDTEIDISNEFNSDKSSVEEGIKSKLVLTNHNKYEETSNFILKYSLFNNSGDIWMKNGYKKYCQYYDLDQSEFRNFFVDPMTTEGAEKSLIILKGRKGDNSYTNQNTYSYLGRSLSTLNGGNLHPNYHYASILNYQNNEELNKLGLTITLKGINSNIYRYKRIPVVIFNRGNILKNAIIENSDYERNKENKGTDNNDANDFVKDDFLSGFYVVRDFYITWNSETGFNQVVNLIRREWPIPNTAGNIKNVTNNVQ